MPQLEINESNFMGIVGPNSRSLLNSSGFNTCDGFEPGTHPYYNLFVSTSLLGGFIRTHEGVSQIMQVDQVPYVSLTGTLTFTKNSTAVTGVACAFSTEIAAGHYIKIDNTLTKYWYQVASVTDNNNLTLQTAFQETTASGGAGTSVRNLCPTGLFFWSNYGGSANDVVIIPFQDKRIAYSDGSSLVFIHKTYASDFTHTAATGNNPHIIAGDAYTTIVTSGSFPVKVKYSSSASKWWANYVQDKTNWGAIAGATLTWNGTDTVTSDIDISAIIEFGNYIRRSSTSLYLDEIAYISANGLTITLKEASLDTGASAAGGAQHTTYSAVITYGKFCECFKNKMFVAGGNNLYWSVTGDLENFNETDLGAGSLSITGGYGTITALASYEDYLFVFRETGYHVYTWTGDLDEPITETKTFPYGNFAQTTTIRLPNGIMYLSVGSSYRITNGVNDTQVAPQAGYQSGFYNEYYWGTLYGNCWPSLSWNPSTGIVKRIYFSTGAENYTSIDINKNIITKTGLYSNVFKSDTNTYRIYGSTFSGLPSFACLATDFRTVSGTSYIYFVDNFGMLWYFNGFNGGGGTIAGSFSFYLSSGDLLKNIKLKKVLLNSTGYYPPSSLTLTIYNLEGTQLFSETKSSFLNELMWRPQSTASGLLLKFDVSESAGNLMSWMVNNILMDYDVLETT